jgi:NADPH-dependent curcumin reductase CurA
MTNRAWHLKSRPQGMPTMDNFELKPLGDRPLGEGEVRVRNGWLSVDPYMRGRMNDTKSYVPPFRIGKPLDGGAVGEVVASGSPDFEVGDTVLHGLGWREYALVGDKHAAKVDPKLAPLGAYLGVLGMPGLTAYAGLLQVGEFKEGDVVFVSGAAGAVGSIVGQVARLRGASKVIGSAGSADKVKHLVEDLGYDAAFNYKDEGPVVKHLAELAPEGIDVYFDNVGGEHLEAAIAVLKPFGHVVMCGAISQYNETDATPAPRNLAAVIGKRLTLRGMLASDHGGLRDQFVAEVGGWIAEDRLRYSETVIEGGVRNAPAAFLGMLRGDNTGKMLVKLA